MSVVQWPPAMAAIAYVCSFHAAAVFVGRLTIVSILHNTSEGRISNETDIVSARTTFHRCLSLAERLAGCVACAPLVCPAFFLLLCAFSRVLGTANVVSFALLFFNILL